MDAWARMYRDKREELDFFLREEMNEMSDAERHDIMQLQDEAFMAYERVDAPGMQWPPLQAAMLAQIALELSQLVKLLEALTKRVEES